MTIKPRTPGSPYDDSEIVPSITVSKNTNTTTWEGTGFNPEGPAGADGRLDALVVLWVDPDADAVRHERAAPDDAVRAVRNQTYRRRLLDEVWPVESFQWQVEVARSIPITRVARPERWCTDEIVELLRTVAAQVGS